MKKVFSFTLDENVIQELANFCKNGLITKSKLVNKIIKDYIEQEKKNQIKNGGYCKKIRIEQRKSTTDI